LCYLVCGSLFVVFDFFFYSAFFPGLRLCFRLCVFFSVFDFRFCVFVCHVLWLWSFRGLVGIVLLIAYYSGSWWVSWCFVAVLLVLCVFLDLFSHAVLCLRYLFFWFVPFVFVGCLSFSCFCGVFGAYLQDIVFYIAFVWLPWGLCFCFFLWWVDLVFWWAGSFLIVSWFFVLVLGYVFFCELLGMT